MSDSTIFKHPNPAWPTIILCVIFLGLAFLGSSWPSDEYYLDNNMPVPDNPAIAIILGIVAVIIIYSWGEVGTLKSEGRTHEQTV